MNEKLQLYARSELKAGLAKCTEAQVNIFKRMYSSDDLTRDIDSTVDNMPQDRLSRAMEQVEATLLKNKQKQNTS